LDCIRPYQTSKSHTNDTTLDLTRTLNHQLCIPNLYYAFIFYLTWNDLQNTYKVTTGHRDLC